MKRGQSWKEGGSEKEKKKRLRGGRGNERGGETEKGTKLARERIEKDDGRKSSPEKDSSHESLMPSLLPS